ncbi:MAG: iron-sulfur cluster assembly scaffold protein [Candidatus Berkelbacteria bacterium]|nr:iron-sulfur cluster assembly scaffold protein [Candidatus Berkelbacteria bacterium]
MEQYSKEVMDHFANPRNVGEIENPDGVGTVGNMKCGDVMYVFIKVASRELAVGGLEEFIEDIKFKTLGCAAAIASSSMMTELVKGKSLDDAAKVSRDDINTALGILPKQKYHCSILSAEGIHKAIADYKSKQVGK